MRSAWRPSKAFQTWSCVSRVLIAFQKHSSSKSPIMPLITDDVETWHRGLTQMATADDDVDDDYDDDDDNDNAESLNDHVHDIVMTMTRTMMKMMMMMMMMTMMMT